MNILEEAAEIVRGDRQKTHGDPSDNHQATADLWDAYLDGQPLGHSITPKDVCFMNILQKIARTIHGKVTRDTLVDIAGYARNIEILLEDNPSE